MARYAILASMLVFPLLVACNTMEGAGEDIQAGGKKLENSAEKNRSY